MLDFCSLGLDLSRTVATMPTPPRYPLAIVTAHVRVDWPRFSASPLAGPRARAPRSRSRRARRLQGEEARPRDGHAAEERADAEQHRHLERPVVGRAAARTDVTAEARRAGGRKTSVPGTPIATFAAHQLVRAVAAAAIAGVLARYARDL